MTLSLYFLSMKEKQFDLRKVLIIGKKFDGLQNCHHTSVKAGHLIMCGRDFPKDKHAIPAHNFKP